MKITRVKTGTGVLATRDPYATGEEWNLDIRGDSGIGNSKSSQMDDSKDLSESDNETLINSDDWQQVHQSPPSESLLHRSIDTHFENLSLIVKQFRDSVTQTDLTTPSDDTDLSRSVLKHVNLLRGLLNAKQFSIINRSNKKSMSELLQSRENLRQTEEVATVKRGPKRAKSCGQPTSSKFIEVIDLGSSPEKENENTNCQKGRVSSSGPKRMKREVLSKLQPRRLQMDDGPVEISASVIVGTERLRESLRNSGQDEEVLKSLEAVIDYMAGETLRRPVYTTDNWAGSLLELSADTLVRAADAEGFRTVRLVSRLCQQLLDYVAQEKVILQAARLENISNVVLKLCESPIVALEVMDQLLTIMSRVEQILTQPKSVLLEHVALLENVYHILRILAAILKRIEEQPDETVRQVKPMANSSVLNVWRSHWRAGENSGAGKQAHPSPALTTRLMKLENLLRVSLEHAPLFSPLIMECLQCTQRVHIKETLTQQASATM